MFLRHYKKITYTLIGLSFGALIIHPYVMLVYLLTDPSRQPILFQNLMELRSIASSSLMPNMLPMSAAFAFFCGVIGFLIGILIERNNSLISYKYELERRESIMKAIQQLISVLSHYILNSSMIIGGNVRRLYKVQHDDATLSSLRTIELQAKKSEAVLKLMQEADFLESFEETENTYEKLLQLTQKVEKRLIEP